MAPTRIAGIEYAAMPKAGTRAAALAWPPKLVVIHDTGNNGSTRYNEASYAANRTDAQSGWTSAHAYVDTGGVLGSLPLDRQAWAAYGYANRNGWHIEMCRTSAGVDPRTVAHTTPVVRWLCQQAGIPMRKLSPADVAAGKLGICGHRDITLGLGVGDHEDPGANFDWTTFMAQVTGGDDDMLKDETIPGTATPGMGDRNAAILLADIWNVLLQGKTMGGALWSTSPFATLLGRPAVDAKALASALAPVLAPLLNREGVEVTAEQLSSAVNEALASDAGQAALVQAANKAEDS